MMDISPAFSPSSFGPPAPVRLDDVVFFDVGSDTETAWRDNALIGGLHIDDVDCAWVSRKLINNEWTPWRSMRSRAEARAFIVSKIRQ